MIKSITLRAFSPTLSTLEKVEIAKDAGFQGVEVNLEPQEEYSLESEPGALENLRQAVQAQGMMVSSVYSRQQWQYPITSQDPSIRETGQSIILALVEAASVLETDTVLVVPGGVDTTLFNPGSEITPYEVAYQNALRSLKQIVETMGERYQINLAVENCWNKFLLSPLEFRQFIDEIDSQWVGVYFDVGNVLRTGFPEDWIGILGSRIRRVHLKDFRLEVDNINGFVNLLEGDINWPAVADAFNMIGYDSWLTAEVLPAYRYFSERLVYETSYSIDEIFRLGDNFTESYQK